MFCLKCGRENQDGCIRCSFCKYDFPPINLYPSHLSQIIDIGEKVTKGEAGIKDLSTAINTFLRLLEISEVDVKEKHQVIFEFITYNDEEKEQIKEEEFNDLKAIGEEVIYDYLEAIYLLRKGLKEMDKYMRLSNNEYILQGTKIIKNDALPALKSAVQKLGKFEKQLKFYKDNTIF